jgi:hypothetical protein
MNEGEGAKEQGQRLKRKIKSGFLRKSNGKSATQKQAGLVVNGESSHPKA